MVQAVEKVRNRLLRAAAALEKAGISYALLGEKDLASLPPKLAARLRELLENPEG